MIEHVRYVCPVHGIEKTSQNVEHIVEIDSNINWSDFNGAIVAKSYIIVNCSCEQEHKLLTATEHKFI
jgi:hypothetical protein